MNTHTEPRNREVETINSEVESGIGEAVFELASRIDTQIAEQEDRIRNAQQALSRLKNVRRKIENAQRELGTLPEGRGASTRRRTSGAPGAKAKKGRRYREGSAAHTVLTVARQAIQEAGRALNRVEIRDAIKASGRELKTKKPLEYINKVMWDSTEFCSSDDGYFFADQRLPDGAKGAKPSKNDKG